MLNSTEPPPPSDDHWLLPMPSLVPGVIVICCMILLAVLGNILIIISYIRDSHLHTVHNLYILNLACTDLCLACISMPFYAVYTLGNWHWPFGTVFCKFFLVVDYTLCFESVLLIIAISLDRLILVSKGAFYMSHETIKVARLKVVVTWSIAIALYSPAIIGWDAWTGQSIVERNDCDVEFSSSFNFVLGTSIIEFGVPFISITVLNTMIFVKIRNRKAIFAAHPHANVHPNDLTTGSHNYQGQPVPSNNLKVKENNNLLSVPTDVRRGIIQPATSSDQEANQMNKTEALSNQLSGNGIPVNGTESVGGHHSLLVTISSRLHAMTHHDKNHHDKKPHPDNNHDDKNHPSCPCKNDHVKNNHDKDHHDRNHHDPSEAPHGLLATISSRFHTMTHHHHHHDKTNHDLNHHDPHHHHHHHLKAARALGLLVLALAICWAPYTFTTIINAICDECVNKDLYETLNWLLWSKSCINPFLYAMNCTRFRMNMKRLLLCGRGHHHMNSLH